MPNVNKGVGGGDNIFHLTRESGYFLTNFRVGLCDTQLVHHLHLIVGHSLCLCNSK